MRDELMNNEEINKAMAKIAGWKNIATMTGHPAENVWYGEPDDDWNKDFPDNPHREPIPNYCNDLNLVREVELGLKVEGLHMAYVSNLELKAVGGGYISCNTRRAYEGDLFAFLTADAKTRCLAIIKTWEEKC